MTNANNAQHEATALFTVVNVNPSAGGADEATNPWSDVYTSAHLAFCAVREALVEHLREVRGFGEDEAQELSGEASFVELADGRWTLYDEETEQHFLVTRVAVV